MRVVGILLVAALMVLPVAAAQQVSGSFRGTVRLSLALGVAVSVSGLVLSFVADLAPGATIVLVAIATFLLAAGLGRAGVGRRT